MGKTYTDGILNSYAFNPTNNSPVDARSVVDSYSSLFQSDTWTELDEIYTYSGMPVVVSEPASMTAAVDSNSGLYVLMRDMAKIGSDWINGHEYIYDPDAVYSSTSEENKYVAPVKENGAVVTPGRSNLCGWLKIASIYDSGALPPVPGIGDWVLTKHEDGTLEWTTNRLVPEATENHTGKVLTVIPDPQSDGEVIVAWQDPQSGGTQWLPPIPNEGEWVLRVDNQGGATWEEYVQSTGIKIKNFSVETTQDADARPIVPVDGEVTAKETLTNSGEVIAVHDPSDEDASDQEETKRPFKLMIDYSKITNLTINGGDSTGGETESFDITLNYFENGQQIYQITTERAAGTIFPVTPTGSVITINGTQYTVTGATINGSAAPSQIVLSEDIDIDYTVEAVTAWEPVLKYVIQSATDIENFDWTSDTATALSENNSVLPAEARSSAQNGTKYFYKNSGNGSLMILKQSDASVCRLRSENAILDKVSWWDGPNNSWRELNANTEPGLTVSTRQDQDANYYDLAVTNVSTDTPGLTLVYRFEVKNIN